MKNYSRSKLSRVTVPAMFDIRKSDHLMKAAKRSSGIFNQESDCRLSQPQNKLLKLSFRFIQTALGHMMTSTLKNIFATIEQVRW